MKNLIFIASAIIISIGIALSGGIYSYDSKVAGTANRYNKFTGQVSLCINGKGCHPYKETSEPNAKADCSKVESELDRYFDDCK